MSDENCPDCGRKDGTHTEACQVGWALGLRDVPSDRSLRPNPFAKLIKEATAETREVGKEIPQ